MRHVLESPWSVEAMVKAFGVGVAASLELLLQLLRHKAGRRRQRPLASVRRVPVRKSVRRAGELRRVRRRWAGRSVPGGGRRAASGAPTGRPRVRSAAARQRPVNRRF
ncbi:hypothetical protein GCM10009738_41840 [Kitasatospora viridis]